MMRSALVTAWVVALIVVLPLRASSHPSDFETLTIDLLFGAEGLHAVDAAVVESSGPSYQPGPSIELQEMVAHRVLEALGLSAVPVDIDLENSERYHWVGFTIRFPDPTLDGRAQLEFSTRPLQDIVAEVGLKQLKLTICHGFSDALDPRDVGRRIGEEVGCNGRFLTPDESHSITLSIQEELPMTGLPTTSLIVAALTIAAAGLVLVALQAHSHSVREVNRK